MVNKLCNSTSNVFSEPWEKTTIGALATYINGRAFKPKEWGSKGLPIIRIQNLNNPAAHYNYGSLDYDKKFLIKNGDLLFAWSASLGSYIWSGGNAWLNQHIFKVIPKDHVNKKFLYYLLVDITAELYSKAHGSGMVHVTKDKFESTEVYLPSLSIQKELVEKIEELFSELDSGIASLKTAQQQLKVYRQALLKHAFEGKLTEQWRKDNADKLETPEQLLARIQTERETRYQQQLEEWKQAVKDWEAKGTEGKKPSTIKKLKNFGELDSNVLQSLNKLPSNWHWGKIGSLATSVEYGTSAKSSETGEVPVIRMGNMQGGKIDWGDLVYTSDEEEIEKYRLSTNDVLFNRTNSPEWVGKTVKYSGERPAIFAGYLIRINYVEKIVDPDYLNYFLNSQIAKNYGNTVKTDGVNQSNINGEKLQHYPFPFCSLAEQQEIVNKLEEKLSIIEQNEKEIESALAKAELLRQSILKKAFSGQLIIKN